MTLAKKKTTPAFRARLRQLRDAVGISQVRTAKIVGVHIATYMRWERLGETEPTFSQLCVLADTFGVTLNDFVTEAPPAETPEPEPVAKAPKKKPAPKKAKGKK
ncbi:helix-turn-helix protein [Gemmata sp. SH-PL17]|uniref:helix-turn-helix domain-containing protein n=1 Tax=Gemmata sp. SH-PL17 TaxID=1630693 RepID=UPI0004ADD026|nr:helix-turn-helix transcriptional regulator [Gemmata sp. SH-PL17]AMV25078.1 helix-turn-helix protein [Gemmata sp. SH-PL17]